MRAMPSSGGIRTGAQEGASRAGLVCSPISSGHPSSIARLCVWRFRSQRQWQVSCLPCSCYGRGRGELWAVDVRPIETHIAQRRSYQRGGSICSYSFSYPKIACQSYAHILRIREERCKHNDLRLQRGRKLPVWPRGSADPTLPCSEEGGCN